MKISKTHQRFVDILGTQRALEYPEEFLGPNWKDVLNFWLYLDTLSLEQFEIVDSRYWTLDHAYKNSLRDLAWNASGDIVGGNNSLCSFQVSYDNVTGYATLELIGVNKILGQGNTLTIVPLFLNL
jgi:hypothetical protein